MDLQGVLAATIAPSKPVPEPGKKEAISDAFALLLAVLVGGEPQPCLLPEQAGQSTSPGEGGKLPVNKENDTLTYPSLSDPLLVYRETVLEGEPTHPLPLEEGEQEVWPQPVGAGATKGKEQGQVFPRQGKKQEQRQLQFPPLDSPAEGDNEADPIQERFPPRIPPPDIKTATQGREQAAGKGPQRQFSSMDSNPSQLAAAVAEPELQPVPEFVAPRQAAPPLEVTTPDFVEELVARVEVARADGETQLHIQLKPEILGKMRVEFLYQEGKVSTRLVAESIEVRELLAAHLPVLREALSQQGLQQENVDVNVFVDQQNTGDTAGQGNAWNYQQSFTTPPEQGNSGSDLPTPEIPLTREGLDYLV